MRTRRCLHLEKGGQTYVFRFYEGQESEVLARFVELAAEDQTGFDWFDAALLSYLLGRERGATVGAGT